MALSTIKDSVYKQKELKSQTEYDLLPANLGIESKTINELTAKYNELIIERNRLLMSSTEENPVVSARANKIGIPCLQGVANKKYALTDYCQKNEIEIKQVAYVGNDINDKDAMAIVGFTFCPADAHETIKEISDHVFKRNGGDGVIRELLDLIKENI